MIKKILLISSVLCSKVLCNAQNAEDAKSIKRMCGCYKISFNYAETFSYSKDSNYIASPIKHDGGLEWVQLLEDEPQKISMQHILIVSDSNIVKHWRQDWNFENTSYLDFLSNNQWKKIYVDSNFVKGQWTQRVFQVDDSPRYEGIGYWVHIGDKHYWEATANAPLPRREHTIRSDYNILFRRNRHEIISKGWLHIQDNDKVKLDSNGHRTMLAQERGYNSYSKVEEMKCKQAIEWWATAYEAWQKVRNNWANYYQSNTTIKLAHQINSKPLYMYLKDINNATPQVEIDNIIGKFIQ